MNVLRKCLITSALTVFCSTGAAGQDLVEYAEQAKKLLDAGEAREALAALGEAYKLAWAEVPFTVDKAIFVSSATG
ncbi:MAG: hypothetical protein MK180_13415 [Rhodobacteraceae bacterium]|nr:hypothetical protein [Paracoccaceae bacterium]